MILMKIHGNLSKMLVRLILILNNYLLTLLYTIMIIQFKWKKNGNNMINKMNK